MDTLFQRAAAAAHARQPTGISHRVPMLLDLADVAELERALAARLGAEATLLLSRLAAVRNALEREAEDR